MPKAGSESAPHARTEISQLAALGDAAGLRSFADALPPTLDAAYERARARALALALEHRPDDAAVELSMAAAVARATGARFLADLAELRVAGGDPATAISILKAGRRADLKTDPTMPVLLARSVAAAPELWPAAVGLAMRAGPRQAFAATRAIGAARLQAVGISDDRVRVAIGGFALAVAVAAFLLLPKALIEDEAERAAPPLVRPSAPPANTVEAVPSGPSQPRLEGPGSTRQRRLRPSLSTGVRTELGSRGRAPTAPTEASIARARSRPTPPGPTPAPAPQPSPPAAEPPAAPATVAVPAPPTGGPTTAQAPSVATKTAKVRGGKHEKKEKRAPRQPPAAKAADSADEVKGSPDHAAAHQGGPPGQEKKDAADEAGGPPGQQDKGEKDKGPKK